MNICRTERKTYAKIWFIGLCVHSLLETACYLLLVTVNAHLSCFWIVKNYCCHNNNLLCAMLLWDIHSTAAIWQSLDHFHMQKKERRKKMNKGDSHKLLYKKKLREILSFLRLFFIEILRICQQTVLNSVVYQFLFWSCLIKISMSKIWELNSCVYSTICGFFYKKWVSKIWCSLFICTI